jgi:hypothetical protein
MSGFGALRWFGRCALLGAIVLVSACSAKVDIPELSVQPVPEASRVTGNYAAFVQTGGWQLDTKKDTYGYCSGWTFETDVNAPYEAAMKRAISQSVEKVTFVEGPVAPQDLSAAGYDALIVVHQGNADAAFNVTGASFVNNGRTSISLNTIVAIINHRGNAHQGTRSGRGQGSGTVLMMCDDLVGAVKDAAKMALELIVEATGSEIRSGLAVAKKAP